MKRTILAAAAVTLAAFVAGTGTATATLPMQKQAKLAGIKDLSCQTCHVEKLPKKGAVTHNEKGKWLLAEKDKRKAKVVDGAWLKDYVAPK
jgi:hypothetical protein